MSERNPNHRRLAAADRRRPAARLLRRQFLRARPAGAEDLRRHRGLHGRDGRGDDLLGASVRRISPMLWFSGVLVVLMGGVTLWLQDETFIKMKPTFYYLLVGALLAFGLFTGKAAAQAGARERLSRPGRGGLAQADPQLGVVLLLHGGSTSRLAQQLDRLLGRLQACGARSPSPSCSRSPTSRCSCATASTARKPSPHEPGPVE
jgi:hypothetical protein